MCEEDEHIVEFIRLTREEYATFVHEVNTLYHARFEGHEVAYIAIGNHGYRFRIHGFDDYEILSRKELI